MMTTNTETPAVQSKDMKPGPVNKPAVARRLRETFSQAQRVQVMADGSRWFVRFSPVEILEHWLLLVAFLVLATTGLMQRFAGIGFIAWAVNNLVGGLSVLRNIHHVGAALFGILSLFHLGRILTVWLIKRDPGSMLPAPGDIRRMFEVLGYNLGFVKQYPTFDRYTIEEKMGYWALMLFAPLMVLTGVILWFPTVAARLLPGSIIPAARAIHSITAVLGTAVVLVAHLYYTLVKERNFSIFTGLISEQAMREYHPLEYQRILAAVEEMQSKGKGK